MARTTSYSGKGGVRISVNFSDLLEKIQKAEGNLEEAAWTAARVGAREMYKTLLSEAEASNVPSNVTDKIRIQADRDAGGNRMAARVGWAMGDYDPRDPSEGYQAVFVNYGTPRRSVKKEGVRVQIDGTWKTLKLDRGYIDGRGFIGRAKKKARSKIKKAQKEALEQILEGLPKK